MKSIFGGRILKKLTSKYHFQYGIIKTITEVMMENHNNKFLNEEPEVIDIEDDAEMDYFEEDPYRYKDSTYEIVSKVA